MTPEDYAVGFVIDLTLADQVTPRAAQDDNGVLGASSFGCREQMRRILVKAPKTDSPKMMPALLGSYVDAGLKAARGAANPKLLLAEELPLDLANGHRILVHPDEVDQDEPSVTDYKAPGSLAAIKRGFADERYRRQRHLQYAAAFQNGLVPPQGITRNLFVDRSGKDETPHVEQEPFDPAVVTEATDFLSDVLYAVDNDETAQKDTPRHVCKDYCAWFTACRGAEIETPQILDPILVERLTAFFEAKQRKDEAEALMKDLRGMGLEGLTGQSSTHRIVSTAINPVGKAGYTKIEVSAL